MSSQFRKVIFDNIHGHIPLNRVEMRVLESHYYQRLRWIQQLGFSFYIFPGATHTRHAHALGVLHVMDRILKAIGKATTEDKLFDPLAQDERTQFHRMMRLAAMLHDVGTFPFSHSIELAYINHWRHQCQFGSPKYTANHEVLGQQIVRNTDFEGGITRILKEEGIDPEELSQVISGESKNLLANQLMHSDVDADRMDYLIRDAHHTGIKLGVFDLDVLIRQLRVFKSQDGSTKEKAQEVFCAAEEGLNLVDAFLVSRYFWYSQIINDGTGYKFDLLAAKIHEYFLENSLAYSFEEIMDRVVGSPQEYFTFNDSYFMAKLNEYITGRARHPMIKELAEMLARRQPPAQIKIAPLTPTLIQSDQHRKECVTRTTNAIAWLKEEVKRLNPNAWLIADIPSRDVRFTKGLQDLKRQHKNGEIRYTRDSAKILTRENDLKLLVEIPNSLMGILSQYRNFIPRVYISPKTYEALEKAKVLEAFRAQSF